MVSNPEGKTTKYYIIYIFSEIPELLNAVVSTNPETKTRNYLNNYIVIYSMKSRIYFLVKSNVYINNTIVDCEGESRVLLSRP
jgi:hypothetical protein